MDISRGANESASAAPGLGTISPFAPAGAMDLSEFRSAQSARFGVQRSTFASFKPTVSANWDHALALKRGRSDGSIRIPIRPIRLVPSSTFNVQRSTFSVRIFQTSGLGIKPALIREIRAIRGQIPFAPPAVVDRQIGKDPTKPRNGRRTRKATEMHFEHTQSCVWILSVYLVQFKLNVLKASFGSSPMRDRAAN